MEEQKVYSLELKAEAVQRMQAGERLSTLARELGVPGKRLSKWKAAVIAGKPLRARGRPRGSTLAAANKPDGTAARIAELERLVGQLTADNDFFKGALRRIEELRQTSSESGVEASSRKSRR